MTGLPTTMRAVRVEEWGARPVLAEVPVPMPVGDQVLLRVDAAGLCHSDLHIMDATPGALPYELPFTLGHEVVGTVAAAGDGVSGDELAALEGIPQAVHGLWTCGRCRQCRRGRENYCFGLTGAIGAGIGHDGGLAEYILVPSSRHVVPAGGIAPVAVAPLTDAGLTAFHALQPYDDVVRGGVVVIIGIGGLGHLALQLVTAGRPEAVVAVDPRPDARHVADRLGATVSVNRVEDVGPALADLGFPEGADLVLDFVGAHRTIAALPEVIAPGGQMAWVGSAGGSLEVAKGGDLPRGWGIRAPFWGTRNDLVEVVRLAREGLLRAETATFGLDEAVTAYEQLRNGQVQGRAVVVPAPGHP
ncbi:alcohol dehydrogenase catalytic domain-containing protein [Nocardioides panacisoli]|uniref:alcohol dehydrogenase catalytic domain-containing protein n=1 Tax=Nocardioides panacisoli TaxID=627624 RepID=UPI001C629ED0|nr:alcohol dehydrogenase catalytic domain-containing protein [Nocardioides panacisoli]QYJ03585.1 alcohol dehydrogenase catalytic domain-containing protein [Nocardioides panacisoli]